MASEGSGNYTTCALCSKVFYTKTPPVIDYMDYCPKHRDTVLWTIQLDEATVAFEIMQTMTLYSTLMRVLGIKEMYFSDP